MTWKPGQHCFLRFPSFGLQAFSSHPFTICSLPSMRMDEKSELVFYIRHQHGITEKLYNHAQKVPGASVPVLVDGPYGGINMDRFTEEDHLLVIAGGSGAGWVLPFVELSCRRYIGSGDEENGNDIVASDKDTQSNRSDGKHRFSGPLSLRVVLATRDASSRIWFHKTIAEVLSKYSIPPSSLDINIQVYLTSTEQDTHSPKNTTDTTTISIPTSPKHTASKAEEEPTITIPDTQPTRPNLPSIIHDQAKQAAESRQSLSVFVCGPESMQREVANAVAGENLGIVRGVGSGVVYLHSEHFSWA